MNRFIKNPKWLIRGALLAVILAFFAWIYGWGGGDIQVMNFTAEDVERLTLSQSGYTYAVDVTEKEDIQIQMLSLHTDMRSRDGGSEEDVRDLGTDTEAQAIASIARKALNTALNSLDPESYLIIDTLILSPGDKSERDLALEFGLSQKAINKRKQKILKNLKLLVLKLEKSQQ